MSTLPPIKKNSLSEEIKSQAMIIFNHGRYWFHIIFWVLSAFLIASQVADLREGMKAGIEVSVTHNDSIRRMDFDKAEHYIFGIGIGAFVVYLFLLFVIPFARFRGKKRYLYLGFFAIFVIWILASFGVGLYTGYASGRNKAGAEANMGFSLGIIASFSFIIALAFFSFYYFIDLYDQQKNLNRFEDIFRQKTIAETNFLKTQINPHFLFNTLNNIYALSLQQSDRAALITQQLKELCQYMLKECNNEMVDLEGELRFLQSYISLEKLRNRDDNVQIDLDIKGDSKGQFIAPLLLINFVENAFKHGVKSGIDKSFVLIRIYAMDNMLTAEIRNSKPIDGAYKAEKAIMHQGGIGIRNVKRRLALLYPGKHKLRINESAEEYAVYLNITLN